jgi:uncharacterized protein YifE (UPF0438 family)
MSFPPFCKDIRPEHSPSDLRQKDCYPGEHLLNRHIKFYRDLETGHRRPRTAAQERFVRMTRGQVAPETVHEAAYAKHMRLRARQHEAVQPADPHDPSLET